MRNIAALALIVACIQVVYSKAAPRPVVINPSFSSADTLRKIAVGGNYHVAEVIDARGGNATDTLGRTRVGLYTTAPLVTQPHLVDAVRSSCIELLKRAGAYTDDRFGAQRTIVLTIHEFSITESSGFFQTIQCKVRFEALVRETMSGEEVRRFMIESEDTKKAFDTTRHARTVARNALREGLARLMESLGRI